MIPGFVWVQSSGGEKVVGAVEGGGGMYIGRANHQNDLVPGKVHCAHHVLYVPWGKFYLHKNEIAYFSKSFDKNTYF